MLYFVSWSGGDAVLLLSFLLGAIIIHRLLYLDAMNRVSTLRYRFFLLKVVGVFVPGNDSFQTILHLYFWFVIQLFAGSF